MSLLDISSAHLSWSGPAGTPWSGQAGLSPVLLALGEEGGCLLSLMGNLSLPSLLSIPQSVHSIPFISAGLA